MNYITIGTATLNQTPLDWAGNADNIRAAIAEARRQQVSLLCLPEMCIPGYGCEDMFLSPSLHETSADMLFELLPETKGMIVAFGLPVFHRNGLFNTACLAADGELLGFVAKRFLAGDGIHYEPRWFKAWPEGRQGHVRLAGRDYPIGDLYFDCGGCRIGFEICEDAWAPGRPGAMLARKGVDVILCPSASHFAFDKLRIRRRFVLEGSRAFGVTYVYSNLVGNESGRAIYDGGSMIASKGDLMALGPRFLFAQSQVTAATVDVAATRMLQARVVSQAPAVISGGDCVSRDYDFPDIHDAPTPPLNGAASPVQESKNEEFTRAVGLGLFDYLRKSRSSGFVVSLSGGADSSATAVLVGTMVRAAVAELGLAAFKERLGYIRWSDEATTAAACTRQLLTCVYQATRNSSAVTRKAAQSVAQGVGADFLELNVDQLVSQYTSMIEGQLGRELSWQNDDVALQNIQARVRAPGVWLLANVRGALLLATSNRSEAAVGYATMDGDTCGGLSPIAGIDKAFLRRWLSWMELQGPEGLGPCPYLATVTGQQPTAELRPPATGQTDEQDLMPYEVLDLIERAAIRDKLSPILVWRKVRAQLPDHDQGQLAQWVGRFFRLFARNQWKRERYAPSFHLDDENLDPKTWCRFPILSGGFARELAMLKQAASPGPGGQPKGPIASQ
jgi:NAD+ synthase (glutamine-hydrolysing)